MKIINYYKNINCEIIKYYNGLESSLFVLNEYINTLREDRIECVNISNDLLKTTQERRIADYALMGMVSSASNDIFEEQLSKILGLSNIDTKHGWDGNDENHNEPYEYKPTKIKTKNYFGCNVNINDESINKINNISPHKVGYNNSEANFVISPINKDTSEFICIYKFKESILHESRLVNLEKQRGKARIVYGTNIKKCIELSKKYNEKYYQWHNPKFF